MKPHLVSEIHKDIRDILVRRSPQVAALGYIPDGSPRRSWVSC